MKKFVCVKNRSVENLLTVDKRYTGEIRVGGNIQITACDDNSPSVFTPDLFDEVVAYECISNESAVEPSGVLPMLTVGRIYDVVEESPKWIKVLVADDGIDLRTLAYRFKKVQNGD